MDRIATAAASQAPAGSRKLQASAARTNYPIINVCLAIVYCAVYVWCYKSYLNVNYDYVGFDLFARDPAFLTAAFAIAVAPVVCYRGVRAASSAIAVFIYLLLYVPVILTFAFASARPVGEIVGVQLTFMVAMALIFFSDAVIFTTRWRIRSRYDFMPLVVGLTVASIVYMLIIYRGNLGFASFGEDLYEMRAQNEAFGAGLLTRYLSSWLSSVLIPLCLAHALTARKLTFGVIGTAACLTLYVCSANKVSILTPIIFVMFFVVARKTLTMLFPALSGGLALLVIILVATSTIGPAWFLLSAVILMRTIGNGGQLTMAYYDFFSFHPRTGYSNIHGLSLFTQHYPYGNLGLGQVVGGYYWSPYMNANANFWATDGIAALGLVGVLVASVVLVIVLAGINSITRSYDRIFVVMCFLPFVIGILNASVFSAVWSGGGLFLLLFFIFQGNRDTMMRRVTGNP